eukprot:scaffold77096_cov41-Prasinocladus_malaysianus.AAC.2
MDASCCSVGAVWTPVRIFCWALNPMGIPIMPGRPIGVHSGGKGLLVNQGHLNPKHDKNASEHVAPEDAASESNQMRNQCR